MALLGILLLYLVGTAVYVVRFEDNLASQLAGTSLGAFAFFAPGSALVGRIPSGWAVVLIRNLVTYPMTILQAQRFH